MNTETNCSLGNIYSLSNEEKLLWVARPLFVNPNRIKSQKMNYSLQSFIDGKIPFTEYLLNIIHSK